MAHVLISLGVLALLILVGAFFVAAEFALISLRESQIEGLKERGRRGRRLAKLHGDPNRFLAASQIGVTLAGLIAAAFGAETLAQQASKALVDRGVNATVADVGCFLGITLLIAFISLVVGEQVPKRLALQRPEVISLASAGAIDRTAALFRPVIWALSVCSDALVRMLGGDPKAKRSRVTEEELQVMLLAHEALSEDEQRIVSEVFEAGETRLREVMVPRTEVKFLRADDFVTDAARETANLSHSRYPVVGEGVDDVVGYVGVRDLLNPALTGSRAKIAELIRPVEMFPGSKLLFPALSEMRDRGSHLAVVVDEYGGTAGIVTLEDLIEEFVGDIRDEFNAHRPNEPVVTADGGREVEGRMSLHEAERDLGLVIPEGPYETIAGFIVAELGKIPTIGDAVTLNDADGPTLRIVAMDGRRVERIVVVSPGSRAEGVGQNHAHD